jgi:hypothetical protein
LTAIIVLTVGRNLSKHLQIAYRRKNMSQFEKFKTSEDAAKHAESCGFEVVRGDEKTLLLDIDSGPAFRQFEINRDLVDQLVGIEDYTVWNSQSSKHHVKLKLKRPLSIEVRLLLQTCLGSDVRRELLTYKRILEGETEPSMLFRPRKWGNQWKKSLVKKQENPTFNLTTGTINDIRNSLRPIEQPFDLPLDTPPEAPSPNRWR